MVLQHVTLPDTEWAQHVYWEEPSSHFFFLTEGWWYMPQPQAETGRNWVWGVGFPDLFFLLTFLSLTREARAADSALSAHSRAPHIHPTLSSSTSRLLNIVTMLLAASACLRSKASYICSVWGKVLRVVHGHTHSLLRMAPISCTIEFPRHHLSAKLCFPGGATGFSVKAETSLPSCFLVPTSLGHAHLILLISMWQVMPLPPSHRAEPRCNWKETLTGKKNALLTFSCNICA